MPTLTSLSIRRRGTTASTASTNTSSDKPPSSAPSSAIKHLFSRANTRKATIGLTTDTDPSDPNSRRKASTDASSITSSSTMGNAPSDMNGSNAAAKSRAAASLAAARAFAATDAARSSTASDAARAMPGAEPQTPKPVLGAPLVSEPKDLDEPTKKEESGKDEAARAPEPETIEVKGYDTQVVPHVLNPLSEADEDKEPKKEQDVGDGDGDGLGSGAFSCALDDVAGLAVE